MMPTQIHADPKSDQQTHFQCNICGHDERAPQIMKTNSAQDDAVAAVAADWWSREEPGRPGIQWIEIPKIAQNVNRRATGDAAVDWVSHSERFLGNFPKPRKALSLGCGFGVLERRLRTDDICQIIDGVDLAPGAVEGARKAAADERLQGLSYSVANLNTIELPGETYDVVYAHASLHHTFALEHLFGQVHKTLRPGGVFVSYEYVGPSQMQFPKEHLELADRLIRLIPIEYRLRIRGEGHKNQAPRLALDVMQSTDPSEAIRSREILPLLAARFEIDHLRYIGGSLLLLIFNDIAGNFIDTDVATHPVLDAFIHLENVLIDSGTMPSYHAYVVCHKTSNPLLVQTVGDPIFQASWPRI